VEAGKVGGWDQTGPGQGWKTWSGASWEGVHGGRRVKLSCLGGGVKWVVVTGVEA
jgi:hypothetical protein